MSNTRREGRRVAIPNPHRPITVFEEGRLAPLKHLPDRLAKKLNDLFSMRNGAPDFAKDIDRIEELVFLAGAQDTGKMDEADFDALYFLRQLKNVLRDDELDPEEN